MWTDENRARHNRDHLRSDEEWGHIEPLIPSAKRGGNKRRVDLRAVVNGIHVCVEYGMPMAGGSERSAAAQSS